MPAGIDWATDAWLAVSLEGGLSVHSDPDFASLLDALEDERVLVDIPIGLVSEGPDDEEAGGREVETLARSVVGDRWSSVFTPPCREALQRQQEGADHGDVSSVNRDVTGKGLTVQAFYITDAIAEVDRVLRDGVEQTVREAHPEVCFRAFAGEPLEHSKTTAQGFGERLAALDAVADTPEGVVRSVAEKMDGAAVDADVDDVLDAVALAYTADAPADNLRTLPPDPPRDAAGLRMEMVYRSSEPLEPAE